MAPKLVRKFFSEDIDLEGRVRRGVMRIFLSSELVRINKGRVIKMRCFQKKMCILVRTLQKQNCIGRW